MADPDAAQVLTGAHQERFGSMRALVLNAGVGTAGPIGEYPMKRFEKTVAVNLTAPFTLLQRALPLLREGAAENPQNGAKVVAVSSITGVYAEANLAVYGATKAALLSLVETLNAEESGNGVAGTAIAPAYVDTDMSEWTKDTIPADTMLTVGDVVELVDAVLRLSNGRWCRRWCSPGPVRRATGPDRAGILVRHALPEHVAVAEGRADRA